MEAQSTDTASLLTAYRDLVRVRNGQDALRRGATTMLDADVEPVAAWLRTTADSTILTIANLSDEPVTGYSLSLGEGALCGPVGGSLLGTVGGDPGAVVSPPVVTPAGGVSGWTPIAELAPRSGYLVELAAAP